MRALNGRATIEVAVTIPHTISGTLHFRAFFLFPTVNLKRFQSLTSELQTTSFTISAAEFTISGHRVLLLHLQCKDQEKALVTYLMKQKCQIALVKLWEYTFVFSDVFLLLDSAILEAS
ncbi:hypothetical protein ACSQ67_006431 [Phaseolus vulgaris]